IILAEHSRFISLRTGGVSTRAGTPTRAWLMRTCTYVMYSACNTESGWSYIMERDPAAPWGWRAAHAAAGQRGETHSPAPDEIVVNLGPTRAGERRTHR